MIIRVGIDAFGSAVTNEDGEVVGHVISHKIDNGKIVLILDIDEDGDLDVGRGITL